MVLSTDMNRPGIVIVTCNSGGAISECLKSAACQPADVVVVDNASSDDTLDVVRKYPNVRVIINKENLGFAGGVNQGIELLQNDSVLLLNPDAILTTPLDRLLQAFDDERTGAAAGKLVDSRGVPQVGFNVRRFPTPGALAFEALGINRIWPDNPVNRSYRCADLDLAAAAEVEQPAGAFLLIRRRAWSDVGGFDTAFHPLWFEDVDFLLRLHRRGWRVRYEPAAVARHAGGHSIQSLPAACRQLYWYGSLLRYASKHFARSEQVLVCVTVISGSFLRMFAGALQEVNRTPFEVHGAVIRLAAQTLWTGRVRGAGRVVAGTTR